jgi:hypothetical protein
MKGVNSEDRTHRRNDDRDKNFGKPSEDPEFLKDFKKNIDQNISGNENVSSGIKGSKRHGVGGFTGESGSSLPDQSEFDFGKGTGHTHITRSGHLP